MKNPNEQADASTTDHFAFLDTPDGMKAGVFVLVVCIVTFIAHDYYFSTPRYDVPEAWKQHTFVAGKFQISVPAAWKYERLEDDAPGRFGTEAWADPETRLTAWVQVYKKESFGFTSLTEFRDARTSVFNPNIADLTDSRVTHIAGDATRHNKSLDTIVTASNASGQVVTFHFRRFDFEDYWVEVMGMIAESNPNLYQETIDRILDSVRPTQ